MNEKRYYWLKLEENYFDLKVQKALRRIPSGSDMLICYLKMQLRYLNTGGIIEYQGICNDLAQELALELDEEEGIVKMTLGLLEKWKVIEPCDSGIYLAEMQGRIGSKSDVALRVAKHRENQKMLHCNNDVTKCNSIKEIDIEKEKDIEIDKNRFKAPTLEEVKTYCLERNNNVNPERFIDFYESKGWMIGKSKMKDWKACVRTWEKDTPKKEDLPVWVNEPIEEITITEEERNEFEDILSSFN